MAAVDAVLCSGGAAITTSDSTDLTRPAACIYVGVGGDIKITSPEGDTLTFKNVPTGITLPWRAKRVFATGTTATNLIAGYVSA